MIAAKPQPVLIHTFNAEVAENAEESSDDVPELVSAISASSVLKIIRVLLCHNLVSRLFGFVFRSNRAACIDRLRAVGAPAIAAEMAAAKRHSLPR